MALIMNAGSSVSKIGDALGFAAQQIEAFNATNTQYRFNATEAGTSNLSNVTVTISGGTYTITASKKCYVHGGFMPSGSTNPTTYDNTYNIGDTILSGTGGVGAIYVLEA